MIYLDNGATTFPKPKAVINAINNSLELYGANPGRSGHDLSIKASEIMYECREQAANLFGIDKPENIIFTNNCTTALNSVIKGTLKQGDHAVISSLEHNAVVRPLEKLKAQGVEYSIAQCVPYDDEKTIENFRNSIKENTKLIICIHASNFFGIKLPVERIAAMCRIYGILFCVDAAQTAGVVNYSLKNSYIDYLCTAGHKGLYGPMGTGLLVINSDTTPDSFIQGGTGSESASSIQPSMLPDKYESGTPNIPGIAGLLEGIKFVQNKTTEKIEKYEMNLTSNLYDKFKALDNVILYTKKPQIDNSVSVLSFNVKNFDSEETAEILNRKYKIAVRAGLHCAPLAHKTFNTEQTGTVRAVVSVFNRKEQLDYFVNSVRKIIK